jgi:hypothetical protein
VDKIIQYHHKEEAEVSDYEFCAVLRVDGPGFLRGDA